MHPIDRSPFSLVVVHYRENKVRENVGGHSIKNIEYKVEGSESEAVEEGKIVKKYINK